MQVNTLILILQLKIEYNIKLYMIFAFHIDTNNETYPGHKV